MHSIIISTLLLTGLGALIQVSASLTPLPENLKVEAYLSYSEQAKFLRFRTTEYVSFQDGSIRLDLLDVSDNPDELNKRMSFFRLTSINDREDKSYGNKVIFYNPEKNRCGDLHLQVWPLKDFSRLLAELTDPRHKLSPGSSGLTRTLLGPAGLLQLMHANSELFVLDGHSRDELSLRDEFHYVLKLPQWDKNQKKVAKIIVTMSFDTGDSKPVRNTSTLGDEARLRDIGAGAQVASIAIVIMPTDGKNFDEMDKLRAADLLEELYHGESSLVIGVHVSYMLVQERSLTRHLGLSSLVDEMDEPFLMPAGLGCGAVSNNRPFSVRATQFSGQFEASDFGSQFYVAYDLASNHLRYDVLGQFKMIYALSDHSVTFVAADSTNSGKLNAMRLASKFHELQHSEEGNSTSSCAQEAVGTGGDAHYDKGHCAQASLIDERGPAPGNKGVLYNRKSLESILGLGEIAGLMYLGQARLPNTDHAGQNGPYEPIPCHVFELPIAQSQIPALLHMHMRLKPRENNQLTVVFYFVDEINPQTKTNLFNDQLNAYESLWLKRVELLSRNDVSKYVFSNAQLTFSKSSWSLETLAEDTRNHNQQLGHPIRTFDLRECWPERALVQLNVVLEQQNQEEWTSKGLEYEDGSKANLQRRLFDESLMNFLWRQIGFARSKVSDFSFQAASSGHSKALDTLLIQAKLTFPFGYNYQPKLVGWLESYEPLVHKQNQVVFVSHKSVALVHECSLALATQLGNPYKFNMLFCPNIGCALLLVEPNELLAANNQAGDHPITHSNYHQVNVEQASIKADQNPSSSKVDIYRDMCEVHQVNKMVSQLGMISKDHRIEMIAGSLKQAAISIEPLAVGTNELKSLPYRAQVTKVSVESGTSLQAPGHDEQIISSLCYTPQTRLLKDGQPYQITLGLFTIKQLALDQHHSRAHCRKACAMFAGPCQTYSYNHAKRICLLTNIMPQLLQDPSISLEEVETLENDCAIYALDSMVLFRRTPSNIIRKPVELLTFHGSESETSVLLRVNLGQCAQLAQASNWLLTHENGQQVENSKVFFNYMQLKQLCVLDDLRGRAEFLAKIVPDSGLQTQIIDNIQELKQSLGGLNDTIDQIEAYESYRQNLQQFYAKKFGFSITLNDGANDDKSSNSLSATSQLTPSVKNLDIDYEQCLSACSFSERHCVMFDYCAGVKGAQYSRSCHLYNIRSPFALEQLDELHHRSRFRSSAWPKLKINATLPGQKLTPAEELIYLESVESAAGKRAQLFVKANDDCQHYYLTGDNLYIKRLLAQPSEMNAPAIKDGANQLEAREVDEVGGWWLIGEKDAWFRTRHLILLVAQTLIGLAGGMALFIAQPILAKAWARRQLASEVESGPTSARRRLDDIKRVLGANKWRRGRRRDNDDQMRLEMHELNA